MNSTGRVWARIRRIAASDRISGLIMLAFAFAGLVLANLPWTSHMFEAVAETQLGIPGTNIILPIGHWAQDGLLTIFFLTVGLDLKQELTTGSLADPKAAAVPMLCAVGGMLMPPVLFITVISLFSRFAPPAPGIVTIPTGAGCPVRRSGAGVGDSHSDGHRLLAGGACVVRQGAARFDPSVPDDARHGR